MYATLAAADTQMYKPSHFEESRLLAMHSLIRAHPFATLVSATSAGVNAEHLPLLLLESPGSLGTLQGHVSRANPVWREVGDASEVLAIFQGANRYISPKWYPSKQEHGRVVPTWNYLVVHARGRIKWNHDPVWLRGHLETATTTYEGQDEPWQLSDAPPEFIDRMLEHIVGFEMPILAIDGKWKLSQNRSEGDRLGVIQGLRNQADMMASEMLKWMVDDEGGAAPPANATLRR